MASPNGLLDPARLPGFLANLVRGGMTNAEKKQAQDNIGSDRVLLLKGAITPGASELIVPLAAAAGYAGVLLRLIKVKPVGDGASLNMRVKAPGNAGFDTAGYSYDYARIDSGSWAFVGSTNAVAIELLGAASNSVVAGVSGEVQLMEHESATQYPTFNVFTGSYQAGGPMRHYVGGGMKPTAQATSELQFSFHNGNIANGKYALYGIL